MALSTLTDGRFVEVSDAFVEILGFRREEIVGNTSLELNLWVEPEQREAAVADLDRDGSVRDARLEYRTKQGEVRTGLFSADIIEVDGSPHLLTVMNDITDRLRAERERRISDERYRLISELTSDYAYSFRVDAESGLVLDWLSGAIEDLTGFTLAEIVERGGWESLIHPDDIEIPRQQLAALLAGRAETVEYRMVTKSREARWVRDYARPEYDAESGQLTHIHGAVQDIAERRLETERRLRLEGQIQQCQKLESLGILAGGIAHDFNNLLMAIVGYSDLATEELPDSSPAHTYVHGVRQAADRGAELVKQLLVYAGKGSSSYEKVELEELVHEMAKLLEVTISKKIEMRLEFATDLPAITADAMQIRQVCMNLVTNASEAIGDESGTIVIRAGSEYLEREPAGESLPGLEFAPGEYLYLEVADDGEGMDAATRSKIFEPFYTTKFDGRGLGLAVIQGIIRGHSGWITIQSEVGIGSTIRAYLPVSESRERAAAAVDLERDLRFDGRTVLLVDDEEAIRAVGRRMLERLGMQVITANDGQEALEKLAAEGVHIDVVLMDLTMPRMSGPECMPELRRLHPHLPLIFASGCGEQDLTDRCGGWPHTALIPKPFDHRQLAEKLYALIG